MFGVTGMNNKDFENSFILILRKLGVTDHKNRTYIINPIREDDKPHNDLDDMMRNFIFPKRRRLSYEQFINLFTVEEGYYPCWMDIVSIGHDIEINTSLRMRKQKETRCVSEYHPFRSSLL